MSDEDIVRRFPPRGIGIPANDLSDDFIAFARYLDRILVDSRERSLTFTKLEEAYHWATVAEQAAQ
jgi:hypothetical protein